MNKYAVLFFLSLGVGFGQTETNHKFNPLGVLTGPSAGSPREIGDAWLKASVADLQVDAPGISGVYLANQYRTEHNGVTHLIYKQQFRGVNVLNAEWTVNIDENGQILNSGGALYNAPAQDVALPDPGGILMAARSAVRAVNPALAETFTPLTSMRRAEKQGAIRLSAAQLTEDLEGEMVWYAVRGVVQPAWLIYVTDTDNVSRYATVIDSVSQTALSKQALTFFQSAPKGQVFERESPQPNPNPGTLLTAPPAIATRTVQSFSGDPKASPLGWVAAGNATAGNNTVTGENLTGTAFLRAPDTSTAAGGDFSFPLQLGPGMPAPTLFKDATNTNLFYWVNRAHDLHYLSGFDEAAGNFQTDNYGRGGQGGDPVYAYTHYGAGLVGGRAQILNAFFSWRRVEDGSQPMLAMFISRPGPIDILPAANQFTDGSLDSQVIVHEYTHGVSSRLARQAYTTFQGASMGEAWSDFFSLEYTLPNGAPPDGIYPVAEYLDQSFGIGDIRSRPYSTNMLVNPLTYANLGNVIPFPEVHADGEIWFEAMWEARANLITQFGETEGRRRIRLLVLDGMKLSPPASSMIDMRDAILLADRVDFKGASQDQLWAGFAKRGMGATAYTSGGGTAHVVAAFDLPSTTGKLRFYDDPLVIGEPVRVILQDSNNTQPTALIQLTSGSGDVENLVLARTGSSYTGTMSTSGNIMVPQNATLNIVPGDYINAFYVDSDAGGTAKLITVSGKTMPAYSAFGVAPRAALTFPDERRLNVASGNARVNLPFAFPFYNGKFTSMTVEENGALFFDRAALSLTPCTDSFALRVSKTIAPLWSQLTTAGSAQPGEGVFLSQTSAIPGTPATFTVRWAAETFNLTAANGGRGNPVNIAATLSDDGTILFNYGTGNTEIGQALTAAQGCNAAATVGISNGHDVYAQSYTLAAYSNAALRLDAPFNTPSYPNGTVDSPADGAHVKGVMTVTGVAWDPGAVLTRVDVLIDGMAQARASLNLASAAFCATQNVPGCPRVGYSASINLAGRGIAPGAHTLKIRTTNSRGAILEFPANPVQFTVDAGQGREPYGKVETLNEGDAVTGLVPITGYAAAHDLLVLGVDVVVDGISYGAATYGVARTDICDALTTKPLNCPAIGFRFTLNTAGGLVPVPDGPHKLQMRVRDETGRVTLVPATPINFTVKNAAPAKPVGDLTSPKTNDTLTGTVSVTGYAYVPGGKVLGGFLLVDGDVYDSIVYGQAAPEACAGVTGVEACPNVGFTASFDSTRFPNGPHIFGVYIVTNIGGSIIVPLKQSSGTNVFIQN
jgi:hypothetical protein